MQLTRWAKYAVRMAVDKAAAPQNPSPEVSPQANWLKYFWCLSNKKGWQAELNSTSSQAMTAQYLHNLTL